MMAIFLRACLSLSLFAFLSFNSSSQSVAINADGSNAQASAMLDIKNPNKGLLIPRVSLSGTADITTIASPALSLLIYNTATAGTGNTAVVPGFYFWNGSGWLILNSGATAPAIPNGTAPGQMLYWNGTNWVVIAAGLPGQYLQTSQSGAPNWTGALFPSASTTAVTTSAYFSTAVAGGDITNDGGAPVTARGLAWHTAPNPTIANSKTVDGTGTGSFSTQMTGLLASTTYYFRAYASNSIGTGYGNQLSFTTGSHTLPTVSTIAVSGITGGTANSGVTVNTEGGSPVTARGVCWSTTPNPTIANNKTINGNGSPASMLGGMTVSTTYYVRAYATNGLGTGYGNEYSFTTTASFGIGVAHQGGVVGYIFQAGDPRYVAGQTHGIIAAPYDQVPTATGLWTNEPIYVSTFNDTTYGTALILGTGPSNTYFIASQANNTNLGATICYNLVLGGYSDWFLPSKDEMTKLYLSKGAIGNFFNEYYSSSSGCCAAYATTVNGYHIAFNGPQAWNPSSAFWTTGPGGQAVRAARYF
jgi:hypothetical protein